MGEETGQHREHDHPVHRRHPHDDTPAHDVERSFDPTEEGVVGSREVAGPAAGTGSPAPGAGLTHDGRFRSGRLAGLTMGGAIWALTWPVLTESALNSLVGLTDTFLAAGLGVAEADAIGVASYIMWFIGLLVLAVGIGATALISRAMGAGRLAVANAVLGQSTTLAICIGVGIGAAVAALAGQVGQLTGLEGPALAAFRDYMLVIALGTPGASVLFILTSCARGAGDNVRPLYAMAARNLVNIAVSFALSGVDLRFAAGTIENPFGLDLGIVGIGIGTLAGDVVGAAVVLSMASRGTWGIRIRRRRLAPHWITVRRLVRLGVPNFVETFGMWFGNYLVLMLVGMIAAQRAVEGVFGAHIIAIRIEAMSFLPGFAMGTAAATLAGQYLGARRPDLARRAIARCTLIGTTLMGLFGLAFVYAPQTLTRLLSSQPEHLEMTPPLLFVCGCVQVPFAVAIVIRGALRGAGDVTATMILTWVSTYAIRLPAAFLLSGVDLVWRGETLLANPMPDDFPISGITGLWVGLCSDLFLRGVLFSARFIQGGWASVRV